MSVTARSLPCDPAREWGEGYDRQALDDDYRLSVQITIPVWQAAYNIPSGIWWHHLERIFLAIDDLGCRDLLTV